MYLDMLSEMVGLLGKGDHEHWKKWFELAQKYYVEDCHDKSFEKVLGAYGGMGSFNDVFWNLSKPDFERLEYVKGELWSYAKLKLQ
ncbi:DUF6966 domain-containing protein [Pseudocolwellia sp. HL-MZ19]|uniref:DUF6966 domain-containing protein n=1 Tax=Pseudocolwellia sp. HL-MZ19 TaxID=3400846 RepID=UPI003CF7E59E